METVRERHGRPRRDDRVRRGDRAACVLCGEPTEYPADERGAVLCPVCEWQEAERAVCGC